MSGINYKLSGTLTQSDNMTRANESPISDGGKWGTIGGGISKPNLVSNKAVVANTSNAFIALWTGDSFANDQYAQITVSNGGSLNNSDQQYAVVRGSVSATTMYRGMYTKTPSGGVLEIDKFVSGTQTVLMTNPGAVVNLGDTIGLAVVGSTLYLLHNGVIVASVQDSALASGSPGFGLFAGGSGSPAISAWEGGSAANSIGSGSGGGAFAFIG